jgi:hypothetical protein
VLRAVERVDLFAISSRDNHRINFAAAHGAQEIFCLLQPQLKFPDCWHHVSSFLPAVREPAIGTATIWSRTAR